MAEQKKYTLSKKTYEEYKSERDRLNSYLHVDIAKKIAEARAQGDLSENADYDAAMDEQAEVAARIKQLDEYINNAEITESVVIKVLDLEYDEEETYTIVGSTEANSRENKISNESPVGKALLNGKEGEEVKVELPNGSFVIYKVLEINKD